MPCWEVRTVTLDLVNPNAEALAAALGEHPGVYHQNGQLVGRDAAELQAAKREYSAQLAERTLRRQGWQVQRQGYKVTGKRRVYAR